MAATLVTTIKRYIGTAAEIAAMTLTGIPTGSTFFESDTGILKVLNAAGALVTAPSESVQLSGSKVVDAVIAQNETDSTEIDFRNYKYMAIQMPAGWDAATLTIKGSATAGGTKQTITNDAGVAFPQMTVAANGIYAIDLHALKIAAIPYLALVASAAQTTAARTIKVMLEQ